MSKTHEQTYYPGTTVDTWESNGQRFAAVLLDTPVTKGGSKRHYLLKHNGSPAKPKLHKDYLTARKFADRIAERHAATI